MSLYQKILSGLYSLKQLTQSFISLKDILANICYVSWFIICLLPPPNKNVNYMIDGTSSVWFTLLSPESGTLTKWLLSTHLLMNKVISNWYVHIMENYTAIKINELDKCYQHGKKTQTKMLSSKSKLSIILKLKAFKSKSPILGNLTDLL